MKNRHIMNELPDRTAARYLHRSELEEIITGDPWDPSQKFDRRNQIDSNCTEHPMLDLTNKEDQGCIEPLRIRKRRTSPIKSRSPSRPILAGRVGSYGASPKQISPFKNLLYFPTPPQRACSGFLSEFTKSDRAENLSIFQKHPTYARSDSLRVTLKTKNDFASAQQMTLSVANQNTFDDSGQSSNECKWPIVYDAVTNSVEDLQPFQCSDVANDSQDLRVSTWLTSMASYTTSTKCADSEAPLIEADPLSTSLRASLRVIGAELPHTVALLQRLNGSNKNGNKAQVSSRVRPTSTIEASSQIVQLREALVPAPLAQRNGFEILSRDTCDHDTNVANYVAVPKSRVSTRHRSTAPRTSTASDQKFLSLMNRLSERRSISRTSISSTRTLSDKLGDTLHRCRTADLQAAWQPRVSLSNRSESITQTLKESQRPQSKLLSSMSQVRRRVPAQVAQVSSIARPWVGTYRKKPIERVKIPACFV